MKKIPFFFLLVVFTLASGAEIRFSGVDLSSDSRLLFSAVSTAEKPPTVTASGTAVAGGPAVPGPAAGGQLFFSVLPELSVARLSAFPEKMTLLDGGRTLLIESVFGVQSLPVSGGLPRSVPGFPSFTGSFAVPGGAQTIVSSPDGNWLLFVEPTSFALGDLILVNNKTGARTTVTRAAERPGRSFPASWSGDSRLFIYSKSGKLYYYTVNTQAPPPEDERYRFVGDGSIGSVNWAGESFYYLNGSALYRVHSAELFAKTPYSGFLDPGSLAGKIPFEFDGEFDSFRAAPDGRAVIISKNARNFFYYPLKQPFPGGAPLPYIMASRAASRYTVIWDGNGATVILGFRDGTAAAYRISGGNFTELSAPPYPQAALSPGGKWLLVWGDGGAVLFDYPAWKPVQTLVSGKVLSCVWTGGGELVIGSEDRVERIRLEPDGTGKSELVCLASVDEYGFEQRGNRVLARSGASWYGTDGILPWTEVPPPQALKEISPASALFRVYLEERRSGVFVNMPMVRNLSGVGTFPLFPVIGIERTAGERRENPAGPEGVFAHGSRTSKKVAVCFDLYDDDAGLYSALDILARCGVKASFFLNGEFVRRYPEAAAEIAAAGHETGSMFSVPIDLSDSRFRITKEFITRGLARGEDEYNKATGKELSLLWHPPWYSVSPEIVLHAASAGYRTIGRDIDPGDWISRDDSRRVGTEASAAQMIDAVMDSLQGGSIIPIRLGVMPGGRSEYLFNKLELLVDAILRSGYEIVPVSGLD
ncbi:MAG: polysaccharide deacetylase family protein [Treponema sp.]|jgi:peptidoglycan/xylan/chitin deacetylase (PgdA/CDA1 family)|nr:polysaccharide deacetylase family protein [Treponema sp.]